MTNIVFCKKYKREMEGLAKAPFPGKLGEEILRNSSKQAWQEWQKEQTMLINERHLDMTDLEARRFLQEQMRKFLSGEAYERAAGYTPPEESDPKAG